VNTDAREQIRLTLDHLYEKASTAFSASIDGMFAAHSAKGQLRSGSTLIEALKIMEKSGEVLLNQTLDKVAAIAQDTDAFAMLQTNLESYVRLMELKLDDVLRVSGTEKAGIVMSAASREAKVRFEAVRSSLKRQIEIHRFTFTKPSSAVLLDKTATPIATNSQKNKGGKPLASHWDQLWANIATQLYVGDLKPQSQADIERAMKDWFAVNDLDIGDTTIRGRARALWSKIQVEK
jgi:hypothetical protein